MQKILFITPPYHCGVVEVAGRWIPLQFVYLAGQARAAGFECKIFDAMTARADHDEIARVIEEERPDFVATSCITATYPDGLEIVRAAKALGAQTILGGVHPTFMWREALSERGAPVDFVVIGEGEQTLAELLTCVRDGGALDNVSGLAFRDRGDIGRTKPRPWLASLDHMPMAWDLLDWELYTYFVYPGSRLAAVSSSRGCSHSCTFCSQQKFWDKTWRGRDPKLVVDELEHLRRTYGIDVALLTDEYPTPQAAEWEQFLDLMIERDLGMKLLLETRVEDIVRDVAILPKYVSAGVAHVYVGIEATNQSTLDLINKDATVDSGVEALSLLSDHDIISETSFVLGFPDETFDSIKETLELSKQYDPDFAHYLAITPWPYAELWDQLAPYIVTTDYRKYNLIDPVVKPIAMTIDDLDNAIVDCYRSFYSAKTLAIAKMKNPERRDYMIRSMRLIMGSSFVRKKMGSAMGMPPNVRRFLVKLGVLGRESDTPEQLAVIDADLASMG